MTHDLRCPSCGHVNAADASHCTQCNFPLRESAPAAPPSAAPPSAAPPSAPPPPAAKPEPPVEISMERIRPIRPRRPKSPEEVQQSQLWLILGGLAVIVLVLYVGWTGFRQNNSGPTPIPGAAEAQEKEADAARAAIARDSTNVNAQIALANVLYDTANWPEAIVHYRSALRLDSTRVTTMVDMGVCYYNLAKPDEAEVLFRQALTIDPNQPVALFNLGIVAENREQYQQALDYYHKAMRAGVPDNVAQGLNAAMKRVMDKLGKSAPPIAPGGAEAPGGMPAGGAPGGK
jgi:cytochrome c-type biogenesis protein CcmH/NrfG